MIAKCMIVAYYMIQSLSACLAVTVKLNGVIGFNYVACICIHSHAGIMLIYEIIKLEDIAT